MNFPRPRRAAALAVVALVLTSCGGDTADDDASSPEPAATDEASEASVPAAAESVSDATSAPATDDALAAEVVAGYAEGVHASYAASLASATTMDEAIDAFVATPDEATLQTAKDAWLAARDDYGPTEAFRFYGGPIDNAADGVEGLVNAWPLDEAYIDYVEGNLDTGIVNNLSDYPDITADVLVEANEMGGEANVATGWHAIEFLLWGQDLAEDGPGARPVSDYTDAPNADRRGLYLTTTSDLLLTHLQGLVDAWAQDADNYRAEFEGNEADVSLQLMIVGIGELSRGELAGERMSVAYFERSQEDEHSCFSDNTTNDIIANAVGIQNVVEGTYPGVDVPGLADLVASQDDALAAALSSEAAASVTAAQAIPAPFDQHLAQDLPDDDAGRASVLATIELLESQTDTIVAAATAVGVPTTVS